MPYLLAAAIAAIALIITPGLFFSFDVTPKLLVLLLAARWRFSRAPFKYLWLMLATLVSLALSTALSPNPALSFYGSGWRRYGAAGAGRGADFCMGVSPRRRAASGSILRIVSVAGSGHGALRDRAVPGLGPDSARRRRTTSGKGSGPSCGLLRRSGT